MNKRRLLKLAELLEADAKKPNGIKFDMSTWGDVKDPDKPMSCGTTACAMGLAAISGAFKSAGLTYTTDPAYPHSNGDFGSDVLIKMPGMDYSDAEMAAQTLFDLSYDEVQYLFIEGVEAKGAKGELAVAKKIRLFVEGYVLRENASEYFSDREP